MAGTPIVSLNGIEKQFGVVPVLDGVNLHLTGGECVGLVGHNGAGKSTLMHILTGTLMPSGGQVLAAGAAQLRCIQIEHINDRQCTRHNRSL